MYSYELPLAMKPVSYIAALFLCASHLYSQQPWVQMYPGFNSNDILDFQRWHGDTLFACGTNGNFILSADGGRTWKNVLPYTMYWDFIRVESDGRDLYLFPSPPRLSTRQEHIAIQDDSLRYPLFRYNVYKRTLEHIDMPTPTKARFMDLSVTEDCITVFQSIRDSSLLVQSVDGGSTWSFRLIPNEIQMGVRRYPSIHFRNKDLGLLISFPIVTEGYAYLTKNGGITWEKIPEVVYPLGFYLDCSPKHPAHWFSDSMAVLISEGNTPYMTTDQGDTWLKKPNLPTGIGSIEMITFSKGVAVGRNFEVYYTHDAWASSISLRPLLYVELNRPLVCIVDSLRWIVGGLHGLKIYTTDGGITWGDEHLTDVYIKHLHFFNAFDGACTLTDIYTGERWYCRTTNSGKTWNRRYKLEAFYGIYHATPNVAYGLSSPVVQVFKTEDGGYSWTLKYRATERDSIKGIFAFVRIGDPDFFLGSDDDVGRLLRTTDGGDTWVLSSGPAFVKARTVQPRTVWGITVFDNFRNELHKSTDNGASWLQVDIPDTVQSDRWFNSIYPITAEHILIEPSFRNHPYAVYLTTDAGSSWEKHEPKYIDRLNAAFNNGVLYGFGYNWDTNFFWQSWYNIGRIFLHRSSDYGDTGEEVFQYSYTRQAVSGEFFFLDDNTIWISIYNTILHTTNGGISWTELPLPGTKSVSLQPNYPNPVSGSGSTTIPFTVTGNREVHVRIEVHDLLGRKVATVHDKPVQPGSHSALWATRGVSPGMYFVRIVGAESEVRKVVVR